MANLLAGFGGKTSCADSRAGEEIAGVISLEQSHQEGRKVSSSGLIDSKSPSKLSTANPTTFRSFLLNSTPIKWMGWRSERYLSAYPFSLI
ncbi:MAG: hypothetical protein LBK55_10185, partial [Azoarcus sp.]|nr:hypothetical protein [Azoarcus sp.]